MKTTQKGIDLIKRWESFSSVAYLCPAGIWTIGYGNTRVVTPRNLPITEYTGEVLLKQDLMIVEAHINALRLHMNQNQFDALVSLIFNIGIGNFKNSKTYLLIKNNPDDYLISSEWIEFRKADGKYLLGLLRRRIDELQLYYS